MVPHVRGLRAAITLLAFSGLVCSGASGQNARLVAPLPNNIPVTVPLLAPSSCIGDALLAGPIPPALASSADYLHSNCETPPTLASVPATVPKTIDPCAMSGLSRRGCPVREDPTPLALAGMGKPGQKISRAREKVLEILESENACSAWYQARDPNPSATFRTISFELDPNGEDSVLESRDVGSPVIFRNPYVAKVIQGDGANATITLNEKGAFFRPTARVLGVRKEGGPLDVRGQRTLRVGPYEGDTFQAQVATLLHEFGHALDMLPVDENDVDGKSAQNTQEVLHYCRSEVEGKANRRLLLASH